jgi:hypothetical protein
MKAITKSFAGFVFIAFSSFLGMIDSGTLNWPSLAV